MTVMGLDVSMCSTGLILLDDDAQIVHQQIIESSPKGNAVHQRMERIEAIVRAILLPVEKFAPTTLCIEAYTYGSNTPGSNARIELGGLLRYVLVRECQRIYEVSPSTLKKWATGAGNAPGKTPVVVALMKRYGVEFSTDDEYDAYALARLAYQIQGLEEGSTTQQKEAILTVTVPKEKKPKKKKVNHG